ncbi:hypothetical protein OH77DRAFT_1416427 [Trametes cingulata]|nr:hypothetical protein OH77DRAFT_1416427 [Trametes cingulata]
MAAFSGLRVYAVSEHNPLVTWAVVLLPLVPIAVNIYLYSRFAGRFKFASGGMERSIASLHHRNSAQTLLKFVRLFTITWSFADVCLPVSLSSSGAGSL